MYGKFLKPTIKVIKKYDKSSEIAKSLEALTSLDVLVGVPQEKASRPGEPINNAELAYIHEHGSPKFHIPIRQFLDPAIKIHMEAITKHHKKILLLALQGGDVRMELGRLGERVVKYVKDWFLDPRNGWPPNVPSVVKRKTKKWSKLGVNNPLSRPLIDTAALLNSISYVIRRK